MVTARPMRGTGADEMHVTERGRLTVRVSEPQPPGAEPRPQEFPETGLIEGQVPGVQLVELSAVNIHTQDIELKTGHARRMSDAQVPSAQHSQTQPAVHLPAFLLPPAARNATRRPEAPAGGLMLIIVRESGQSSQRDQPVLPTIPTVSGANAKFAEPARGHWLRSGGYAPAWSHEPVCSQPTVTNPRRRLTAPVTQR